MTTDYEFLTTSLQQVMVLIYHQKRVNFKEQKIFSNQEYFRREMEKLIQFKKVEMHNGISKDGRKKETYYTLNVAGKFFVEQFILKYQERLK